MRESISLAFIIAVQRLPPRQRAVPILRDGLGFTASEAAQILGCTEESVTSAQARPRQRAPRAAAASRTVPGARVRQPEQLIERLTRAYETGDVDGIVAQFTDDAWLTMPPARDPDGTGRVRVIVGTGHRICRGGRRTADHLRGHRGPDQPPARDSRWTS
jgi:Sigma-70, region 4